MRRGSLSNESVWRGPRIELGAHPVFLGELADGRKNSDSGGRPARLWRIPHPVTFKFPSGPILSKMLPYPGQFHAWRLTVSHCLQQTPPKASTIEPTARQALYPLSHSCSPHLQTTLRWFPCKPHTKYVIHFWPGVTLLSVHMTLTSCLC